MEKLKRSKSKTLMDGLIYELERNTELKCAYEKVGTSGQFGKIMISADIERANNAILSGNVIEMIRAFNALQNNQ